MLSRSLLSSFFIPLALTAVACGGETESSDTPAADATDAFGEAVDAQCANLASCDAFGPMSKHAVCHAFYEKVSTDLTERCNDASVPVAAYAESLRCESELPCAELFSASGSCADELAAYEAAKEQQGPACEPDDD